MIEMLKRLSPVSIIFTEPEQGCFAYYCNENESMNLLKRIEIDKTLKPHENIAILAHEIAHALHDVKNCKCMKNPDYVEREIHAHKDSLRFLLKHKQKKALKWLIKIIREHSNEGCYNNEAQPAAKHIMKLKLWQKCLDYVK